MKTLNKIKPDFNTAETILSKLPYEDSEEKTYLKGFYQYHSEQIDRKMSQPDDKPKASKPPQLSEPGRKRLKQEKESFQREYDLRFKKLEALRISLVIETDVSQRFKLNEQVESEDIEIEKLKHKLEEIEQILGDS